MGYTHYFKGSKPLSQEDFDKIQEVTAKVVKYADYVPLENLSSEGVIDINGVGPDSHENLVIYPGLDGFNFCKTNGKPYDVVIVAILCAINTVTDAFAISSDGDVADWLLGQNLASAALGHALPIPSGV